MSRSHMIELSGPASSSAPPSLLPVGTSFIRSGARRQPVLWCGPDPWSSADVSTFHGHFALSLRRNHIHHFHIFIRNTDISLRSWSGIANMFDGVFSLLHQIPHLDGGTRMNRSEEHT